MTAIIVPYRGATGKQRLAPTSELERFALSLAMLADVLHACTPVGPTWLVTADEEAEALATRLEVRLVRDSGAGQGAAVAAGLSAAEPGAALVVNADLPCAEPRDLLALLGALPADGIALVRAADGTTNALALASSSLFLPLYGPGSERRFREHAARLGVEVTLADIPNLAGDVDTFADLERLEARLGPSTSAALAALQLEPVR
ncbi:MAG: 2-phospho-L-lactate guanylyltransferase [Actinobacteria bacterium]|nr:2-phospho-L-lactate guanylyltransferase [Actinomycetota bacterium]